MHDGGCAKFMHFRFGNEHMEGESNATSLGQFQHVCKDLQPVEVGFPWGTALDESHGHFGYTPFPVKTQG